MSLMNLVNWICWSSLQQQNFSRSSARHHGADCPLFYLCCCIRKISFYSCLFSPWNPPNRWVKVPVQHMRSHLPPGLSSEQTHEEAPAQTCRPSVRLRSVSTDSSLPDHSAVSPSWRPNVCPSWRLQLWQEVLWGQRPSAAHEQAHGPEAVPVPGVWEVLQLEEGLVLARQVAQRGRALQVSPRRARVL